jgi:hypothetical protein
MERKGSGVCDHARTSFVVSYAVIVDS